LLVFSEAPSSVRSGFLGTFFPFNFSFICSSFPHPCFPLPGRIPKEPVRLPWIPSPPPPPPPPSPYPAPYGVFSFSVSPSGISVSRPGRRSLVPILHPFSDFPVLRTLQVSSAFFRGSLASNRRSVNVSRDLGVRIRFLGDFFLRAGALVGAPLPCLAGGLFYFRKSLLFRYSSVSPNASPCSFSQCLPDPERAVFKFDGFPPRL